MDPLFALLNDLGLREPARLICIGAGGSLDAAALRALAPRHCLLVEGDPDAATRLRHRSDLPPQTEVLDLVAGPVSGTLLWHRYSVPALNGPLDASGWSSVYPRLREESTLTREAVAIDDLLSQVLVGTDDDDPSGHVLVLDTPGQEAALLAAMRPDTLRRFGWILVRGCALDQAGWAQPGQSEPTLSAAGFLRAASDHEGDPLQPISAWRFDATALQLSLLQQELAAQQQALHSREIELQQAREAAARQAEADAAAVAALQGRLLDREDAYRQVAADAAQLQQQLAALHVALQAAEQDQSALSSRAETLVGDAALAAQEHEAERNTLRRSIDELQSALEQARGDAATQRSRGDALARAKQAALDTIADLTTRHDATTAEAARLREEHDSLATRLQQSLDETRQALAEADTQKSRGDALARAKQAALDTIADLTARHDAATAEAARLQQSLDEARQAQAEVEAALTRARAETGTQKSRGDALARAKQAALDAQAELNGRLAGLQVEHERLTAELGAERGRHTALAQGKVAADRTTADQARRLDELEKALTARSQNAERLQRELDDQVRLAAERQHQVDAAGREKAQLIAARDEQSKVAREARQRHAAIEAELAEMAARYGLLQEELVKAEAQIELIADLLLREPRG